jgi:hypothetical protein
VKLIDANPKTHSNEAAKNAVKPDVHEQSVDASTDDAARPDFADIVILQQALIMSRPKLVIEYGSGYTTYIIADTISQFGGKLISIELIAERRELTLKRVDAFNNVELIAPSPTFKIRNFGNVEELDWYSGDSPTAKLGILTVEFPSLFSLNPDFVLLDGPRLLPFEDLTDKATGEFLSAVVADPLVFETIKPPVICINSRRVESALVGANLQTPYRHDLRRGRGYKILWPS